jgi:hypothetical protein
VGGGAEMKPKEELELLVGKLIKRYLLFIYLITIYLADAKLSSRKYDLVEIK